jgi:hypothetical protein
MQFCSDSHFFATPHTGYADLPYQVLSEWVTMTDGGRRWYAHVHLSGQANRVESGCRWHGHRRCGCQDGVR